MGYIKIIINISTTNENKKSFQYKYKKNISEIKQKELKCHKWFLYITFIQTIFRSDNK